MIINIYLCDNETVRLSQNNHKRKRYLSFCSIICLWLQMIKKHTKVKRANIQKGHGTKCPILFLVCEFQP